MSERELEARLTRIDSELRRLASAVDSAAHENASAIHAAERVLGGQLTALTQANAQTSAKLESLHQDFASFVEEDRLDKERLIAHAGLILVRGEIKAKFGQYEDVRRNVHGMLQALDGGLAHDATLQLIAETQSITAPSYWLASAQNALAAWIRHDHSAAGRALLHASSCSPGKTALFFGLLNARYGLSNATNKWFREYLNDQDPERLSREFSVVLDAALLGLLGETTYDHVSRKCNAWFEKLCTPENVERQVVRWQSEIVRRCEPASGPTQVALNRQYQTLARVSPDWPRIVGWYLEATAFKRIKAELSARLGLPRSDESAWRVRIDTILRELHTIPEPEELDLRRQEADLQRIVEYRGDRTAAEMARAAEAPTEQPQADLLTFLTNVALHPRRLEVSQETTQLALYLTSQWIGEAAENIARESRTRSAAPVAIEIDGWKGKLVAEPLDALTGAFSKMVDSQTRKEVARERFAPRRLAAALVTVAFVASMTFELTRSRAFQLWPVTALACLTVMSLVFAVAAHRNIPKKTAKAEERGEKRKQSGVAIIHNAHTDRERMLAAWNERIREADHLRQFLSSIVLPQRLEVPGERTRTDQQQVDEGIDSLTPLSRSRRVDYPQPQFELPEWSLEPVWPDER